MGLAASAAETGGRRERECMPQGAPTTASPSHIYMRHFIVSWKTPGDAQCCGECHVRGRMIRDRASEELSGQWSRGSWSA